MAKDPAVLFYTGDFLTGTIDLTDQQCGKYIRLLCVQHQKETNEIPESYFNEKVQNDTQITNKFTKTETGYFNERMRLETNKRKKYFRNLQVFVVYECLNQQRHHFLYLYKNYYCQLSHDLPLNYEPTLRDHNTCLQLQY